LRRRLYPRRGDSYRMIGSSVTDPSWLDEVPGDRPAMVVAEGLMPYLHRKDVRQLLARITGHFPRGELAFDGYSRLRLVMLRSQPSVKATGATFHWALDDPHELEHWIPRLKLVAETNLYDPAQTARMTWRARLILPLWNRLPLLRRVGRLLRYRF